jgi:transcriptional regulator with PAS, ATPase and Fis domain
VLARPGGNKAYELERILVEEALRAAAGDVTRAALRLGVDRAVVERHAAPTSTG